jgi:hypothetical protein
MDMGHVSMGQIADYQLNLVIPHGQLAHKLTWVLVSKVCP